MTKHLNTKSFTTKPLNSDEQSKHKHSNLKTESPNTESTESVADKVDKHLQSLENSSQVAQQRQLSPESQLFTEDELAYLINPDRLKALMKNGDDFLGYLTAEIDKFED
ncbi:hypothetical protein [Psychrobacter lutiphocae]|uniref:hypothetical protein n=1 Tax=Psychrobacter lutiphocae TaxID=540500 RepID=UPI00037917DA|nr:hypothetical protein [Psychrobacter lutiphocae]